MTIPDYLKQQQERIIANNEVENLIRNYSLMVSLYASSSCTESEYYSMLLNQENKTLSLQKKYSKMPSVKKKLNSHLNDLTNAINNINSSNITGTV